MDHKVRLAAFATALLAGTSCLALGAQAEEPTFGWTGFHVGVGGGFGVVNHNAGFHLYEYMELPYEDETPGRDIYSFGGAFDFGGTGDFWTVEAGYDVLLGNRFVLGVGTDYTFSNMSTEWNFLGELCYEGTGDPDNCDFGIPDDEATANLIVHTGSGWSVSVRAGFLATPRTLFYGFAGYSRTQLVLEANLESLATGPQSIVSEPFMMSGLIFGGGVETYISSNVTLGLEYRGTRYRIEEGFSDPEFGVMVYDTFMSHTVRGTLSYRFESLHGIELADGAFGDEPVNWTGFHVGVAGGLGFSNHEVGFRAWDYDVGGLFQIGGEPNGVDVFSIESRLDVGGQGEFVTLGAGFDLELGDRLVAGIFADFTFSSISATATGFWAVCYDDPAVCNADGEPFPEPDGMLELDLRVGNQWTVGGRLGVLTGPRTLVYLLGGYTRVQMVATATLYPDGAPPETMGFDFERSAVTFGAGVEAMLSHNLSATLEYRGTYWAVEDQVIGDDTAGLSVFASNYVQTVRLGLNWRIGAFGGE